MGNRRPSAQKTPLNGSLSSQLAVCEQSSRIKAMSTAFRCEVIVDYKSKSEVEWERDPPTQFHNSAETQDEILCQPCPKAPLLLLVCFDWVVVRWGEISALCTLGSLVSSIPICWNWSTKNKDAVATTEANISCGWVSEEVYRTRSWTDWKLKREKKLSVI